MVDLDEAQVDEATDHREDKIGIDGLLEPVVGLVAHGDIRSYRQSDLPTHRLVEGVFCASSELAPRHPWLLTIKPADSAANNPEAWSSSAIRKPPQAMMVVSVISTT